MRIILWLAAAVTAFAGIRTPEEFEKALAAPAVSLSIKLSPDFTYCKPVLIARDNVVIETEGFVVRGRVSPAAKLATFCDDSTDATITILANNVTLRGIRVATKMSKWNHVAIGHNAGNSGRGTPTNILLDSVVITSEGQSIRGVAANGNGVVIRNSHIAGYRREGADSQAVCMWDAVGPLRLENNYLEGGAENVMIGGAPPSTPEWVPSDIVVIRNHFAKNPAWVAEKATTKNLFECKVCRRLLVAENYMQWGQAPNGQLGFAFVITPRVEGGKAPLAVADDVTIRDNVIEGAAGGINFQVADNYDGSKTKRVDNVLIQGNWFTKWLPPAPGRGRVLQFTEYQPFKLDVVDNWFDNGPYAQGTGSAVIVKDGGLVWPAQGSFVGNWLDHGEYGIMSESPEAFAQMARDRIIGNVFTSWFREDRWAAALPGNVWQVTPLAADMEPGPKAKAKWAAIKAQALAVSEPEPLPIVDVPPASGPLTATVVVTVPATGAVCEIKLVAPVAPKPKVKAAPPKNKSRKSPKKG